MAHRVRTARAEAARPAAAHSATLLPPWPSKTQRRDAGSGKPAGGGPGRHVSHAQVEAHCARRPAASANPAASPTRRSGPPLWPAGSVPRGRRSREGRAAPCRAADGRRPLPAPGSPPAPCPHPRDPRPNRSQPPPHPLSRTPLRAGRLCRGARASVQSQTAGTQCLANAKPRRTERCHRTHAASVGMAHAWRRRRRRERRDGTGTPAALAQRVQKPRAGRQAPWGRRGSARRRLSR